MKVVAIIPARGDSKGIPNKNIINFCGKPLLAWSILQAMESSYVDEVYVSSDSKQILAVGEQYGAIGIVRPDELSDDAAPSESALSHALDYIENSRNETVDLVVFLQATSPLREPEDIDAAVRILLDNNAYSLLSVAVLDDLCAFKLQGNNIIGITYDPYNRGRRQEREPVYHDNGSIYVFRPDVLRRYQNRLGGKIDILRMPFWKSHEIDTLEDLELCAYYFERKLLDYWKTLAKPPVLSLNSIDLLVYDFDGIMTDNRAMVFQNGTEGVFVNRSDGLAVDMLRSKGIRQLILSTETNPVVKARAQKLRLKIIDSCNDKKAALETYCSQENIDLKRVLYIGNDLNDLEVMKSVGFPVAPADAHEKIKEISIFVTKAGGGKGVIRELVDLLLRQ